MIGTIYGVVRGEGLASALRRTGERLEETFTDAKAQARGFRNGEFRTRVLNVSAMSIAPRTGGVAVQLHARLAAEQHLRDVVLLHPGRLVQLMPMTRSRRAGTRSFHDAVRNALIATGASAVHIEGTFAVPLEDVVRLIGSGIPLVISVHDFSLFASAPHLDDPSEPADQRRVRHERAASIVQSSRAVIFPSQFLLDWYRERLDLTGCRTEVIEPASNAKRGSLKELDQRHGVAYAGSLQRRKGAALLPALAQRMAERGLTLHVFGGGDTDLLLPLRRLRNVIVHGYYRSHALPSLLAQHRIGLVVLPSLFAESHSLALSEAWLGGAAVAAFDDGAQGDRIRREGGWLVPSGSGAEGMFVAVEAWLESGGGGRLPPRITTPAESARAHLDLYRDRGLL